MPYSYYGYGDFLANNIYVILLIPVLLLSVWAQAQVSGSFRRYSRVANRRHLTGAQAAEAVLRSHGIYDGLLDGEELDGAKKVLRAAAMTYVAALLMSALQLLRYVLIFLGRDRRGGRD